MLQIIYQGILETRCDHIWERELIVLVLFQFPFQNIFVLKNQRIQILKTININMAPTSLKSLCNFIVLCYGTNWMDDLEFILLYGYSQSRETYLYQNNIQFNLEMFGEAQCVTEFWSGKTDISRLSDAHQLPQKIACCQFVNNIGALCILSKIIFELFRLSEIVPLFVRNLTEISLISNYILIYLYNRFNHLLNSWIFYS